MYRQISEFMLSILYYSSIAAFLSARGLGAGFLLATGLVPACSRELEDLADTVDSLLDVGAADPRLAELREGLAVTSASYLANSYQLYMVSY